MYSSKSSVLSGATERPTSEPAGYFGHPCHQERQEDACFTKRDSVPAPSLVNTGQGVRCTFLLVLLGDRQEITTEPKAANIKAAQHLQIVASSGSVHAAFFNNKL